MFGKRAILILSVFECVAVSRKDLPIWIYNWATPGNSLVVKINEGRRVWLEKALTFGIMLVKLLPLSPLRPCSTVYIVCFKVKLSWLLGNLKREKSWDTYFTALCVYLFWREMFWGCKTHIAGNWIIKRFYLEFPFLEEDRSVRSQFPPIVIISPRKRIYQQRKASEFYCFFHLSLQKVILLLFLHSAS